MLFAGATYATWNSSQAPNTGATIQIADFGAPVISTATLPKYTVGTAYSQKLESSYSDQATWRVSSGSLPTGLSLSTTGIISGTPTAYGKEAFVVEITNRYGSNTKSLTLEPNYAAPTLPAQTLSDATKGTAYTAKLSATGVENTYSVTSGTLPAGLSLNSSTGVISGTPTGDGVSTFTVTATNPGGSASRAYSINVKLVAPTITTKSLPNGIKGTAYSQAIAYTGEKVAFTSTGSLPSGVTLNASSGVLSGTPTAAGSFAFTVVATNTGGSVSQAYTVNVALAAPVITRPTLADAIKGTAYSQTVTATGESVTFAVASGALPAGLTLNASTGVISGTPTTAATSNFTISATNTGGVASQAYTVVVKLAAPTITRTSLPDAVKGTAYSQTVTTTGEALTFSVSAGTIPAGLALNSSTGVISGTPTSAASYNFTVTATNTGGSASQAYSVSVGLAAPSITRASLPNGIKGSAYSESITTTGEALTFTVSSGTLPAGLSLNSSSGLISGTPTAAASYNFTVTATNTGGISSKAYSVSVALAPPVITRATLPDATKGLAYSQTVTASGESVTFALASGALPTGLTLNTATGNISGTPTATGTSNFTISATNSGGVDSVAYQVVTQLAAPVITKTSLPGGVKGTAYSQSITTTGESVTYSISAGTLPTGLTLNSTSGLISGTPTAAASFNFTVTATNAGGSTSQAYAVAVRLATPVINRTSLFNGTKDVAYSDTVTTTGEALTFAVTSGTLPAGLTLNASTGTISGTPTTAASYSFTITASNSGGSDSQAYTVGIAIAPPAITRTTLPAATKNVAYSQTVTATGESVLFSITAGALPAGLSLDSATGTISGTPTTVASYNFTVTATNSSGSASQAYTVPVGLAPPVITRATLSDGIKNSTYSQSVTTTGEAVTYAVASGALPAGLTLNTSTGAITGTPTTVASYNFTVSATNSGGTTSKAYTVAIKLAAPVITTASLTDGTKNTAYSQTITATGESVTYAVSSGTLPAGLTLTSAGVLSGTPTTVANYSFTVSATNSGGTDSKAYAVAIKLAAPVITRTSLPDPTKSVAYSQTITASGESITFARVSGIIPDGLTLNTSTGVISGTPTISGPYSFTISATNSGGTTSQAYSVNVRLVAPTITTTALADGVKGTAYSQTVATTGESVTYSYTGTMPSGLSLNTATGVISGTPTLSETRTFTVNASNSGGTASRDLTILVKYPAPVFGVSGLPAASRGSSYSATPEFTGEGVTFALSGTLPTGLTLNTATGLISGTPTVKGSTSTFQLTATNNGGSAVRQFTLSVAEPRMVTTWNTAASGCTTIKLPLTGTVDATVNWGDGTSSTGVTGAVSHAYTNGAATNTVSIDGTFTGWGGAATTWTPTCIVNVSQWGETGTTSLLNGFASTTRLVSIAETPTTVTSMGRMFLSSTFNGSVAGFKTNSLADTSLMFYNAKNFNQPVAFSSTNLVDTNQMFGGAAAFNSSVSLNTAKVTNMLYMFGGATLFNQPLNFDTSNVTNMSRMFDASAFNQPLNFNTSNVTIMDEMFARNTVFDQPLSFNTAKVTDMSGMFFNATAFSQPVNFDTSSVTDLSYMFNGATSFNQPLTFNTAKVTDLGYMFARNTTFNSKLTFSDTSNVTTVVATFSGATKFNQDIRNWNVDKAIAANKYSSFRITSALTTQNTPTKLQTLTTNGSGT